MQFLAQISETEVFREKSDGIKLFIRYLSALKFSDQSGNPL